MKRTSLLLSLLLCAATQPLTAQEAPPIGPEHEKLAASVGTWDTVTEMAAGPGGEMTKTKGTAKMRLLKGGMWLVEEFDSTFGEAPFEGHGSTGYDPAKGKYVVCWIDSWTPSFLLLEGTFDKSGKVLTVTGTGVGMAGEPVKYRNVTTWKSADQYVFHMYMTGADGKEQLGLTITYTRRAEPAKK